MSAVKSMIPVQTINLSVPFYMSMSMRNMRNMRNSCSQRNCDRERRMLPFYTFLD